jgi:prophage antirepressor-like protein
MKDDGTAKGNKVLYLAEAGFYQLCFSSKLPQAQVFQKWVFDDVLRSIRENGWYLSPDATSEQVKALIEKVHRTALAALVQSNTRRKACQNS